MGGLAELEEASPPKKAPQRGTGRDWAGRCWRPKVRGKAGVGLSLADGRA